MNKLTVRIKPTIALLVLALWATIALCACNGLPGSEDLPTPTPPEVTFTPTPSPTATPIPTATPSPTATPIPVTPTPDVKTLESGWYNSMAEWDADGTLLKTPHVAVDTMIYANNFERDMGNRLGPFNICNASDVFMTDSIAHSGYYSVKASRRRQEHHGVSGFMLQLNEYNGLNYADLVGHVLCIRCYIYYSNEGFGVADSINFTAFDTYHKETALDYVYNTRDGSRKVDKDGNPVLQKQERFVRCNSERVIRNTWTECVFYVTIRETTAPSGGILIATTDEDPNSVGLYCSYYIDDLTVTVLRPAEYPIDPQPRIEPAARKLMPHDSAPRVLDDISQGMLPPEEEETDEDEED